MWDQPYYVVAGLVSLGFLMAVAAMVALLLRDQDRPLAALHQVFDRVPVVRADAVDSLVRTLAVRVRSLGTDRRLLVRTIG